MGRSRKKEHETNAERLDRSILMSIVHQKYAYGIRWCSECMKYIHPAGQKLDKGRDNKKNLIRCVECNTLLRNSRRTKHNERRDVKRID